MKIIYIYSSFTLAGGADRVVIEKANYLAEHGYDVTIVTDSQQKRKLFFPISEKVKLHDLAIDFEQYYKYNFIIRFFIYSNLMKKYKKRLSDYLQKEKADIVITTLGRNMDFLIEIKDGSIKIGESHIAKPHIRNLHFLESNGPLHRVAAKMWMTKITKFCSKLDALVLLTEKDQKNWKSIAKTYVIPNALPFSPSSSSTCQNKQANRINNLIENENPRQKMGKAAKQNVQRYSKDTIMKKWTDLFNYLISLRGKKIMYVFSELTTKGGTDKVLTDKANYLSEHGYDITIVTESQMGRAPVFPLSPKVRLIDIGLNFNKQYTQSFLHRAITYYSYIYIYKKKIQNILNQEKPDIVITTMGRSLDFVTKLKDNSIKIGEAHTTKKHLRSLHLMEERGRFYKWIAKYIRNKQIANARKLSALVLLTPEDANDWADVTKTYVIPNSIHAFPKERAELTNKQAIIVGRYNDAKGYEYLIEAWDIVHKKHPDWKIQIYGSGELHDDVKRWIHEKNLESSMIMNEPTDRIMEKYLESSICVVSSRYEGFSMAIVEAMACGVPCVSFDCPFGPHNIIRDGEDGILVEHLNSKALGESICKVIEDENLRKQLGANAKKNIQRFSQDIIMQQWQDLFHSLINNRT